jgi:hypothetical protein
MKEFKNVVVYKDFDLNICYPRTYTVQVIGKKARILNDNPVFGAKSQSRLNTLNCVGGNDTMHLYALRVNGNFVYIKIEDIL